MERISYIKRLIRNKKPYLIIKYGVEFCGIANNVWELAFINSDYRIRYYSLERKEALKLIDDMNIPRLHRMDSRNAIWGDEKFKEIVQCKGISYIGA